MSLILTIATWMTGSKFGQIAFVIGASLVLIVYLVATSYKKGVNAEQAKQVGASLDALRKRIAVDDKVGQMSSDDRRIELARWMRDAAHSQ